MGLIDIDALVARTDELKPLPASIMKLAALISDGESDMDKISGIISLDPVLTLKLLRTANSAYSGSSSRLTTAKEAVSRLGTEQTLSIAIAHHARSMMRVSLDGYQLREGELWRHSVLAMLAAEMAGPFCRNLVPPSTQTAALLHDIGKLVMAQFLSREILDLIERAHTEAGLSRLEAEASILEVHHGELGGLIAQHWQLPESIVQAIIHHHEPENGRDIVCDATHLANIVAKHTEAAVDGGSCDAILQKAVGERLGFSQDDFHSVCCQTRQAYEKVASVYGAPLGQIS